MTYWLPFCRTQCQSLIGFLCRSFRLLNKNTMVQVDMLPLWALMCSVKLHRGCKCLAWQRRSYGRETFSNSWLQFRRLRRKYIKQLLMHSIYWNFKHNPKHRIFKIEKLIFSSIVQHQISFIQTIFLKTKWKKQVKMYKVQIKTILCQWMSVDDHVRALTPILTAFMFF